MARWNGIKITDALYFYNSDAGSTRTQLDGLQQPQPPTQQHAGHVQWADFGMVTLAGSPPSDLSWRVLLESNLAAFLVERTFSK